MNFFLNEESLNQLIIWRHFIILILFKIHFLFCRLKATAIIHNIVCPIWQGEPLRVECSVSYRMKRAFHCKFHCLSQVHPARMESNHKKKVWANQLNSDSEYPDRPGSGLPQRE